MLNYLQNDTSSENIDLSNRLAYLQVIANLFEKAIEKKKLFAQGKTLI